MTSLQLRILIGGRPGAGANVHSSKLQHRAPSKVHPAYHGNLSHLRKTLDSGVPVLPRTSLSRDCWAVACVLRGSLAYRGSSEPPVAAITSRSLSTLPRNVVNEKTRRVTKKRTKKIAGRLDSTFQAAIPYLGILMVTLNPVMSHTIRKKKKLAHRVARIRGQVDALARALDGEAECGDVMRLIASARGAMDSLMAEVIEGHIRDHAFRGARARSEESQAAEDLVDIIRSYLK